MTEHKSIAAALAAAQSQMGKAFKSAENPHFRSKYADLGAVMDACLPALNANGIAVVQPLTETEFGRAVVTRFIHTSGETLECPVPLILGKQDMQGLGSAMTYARRYGLMALAGIAPEDDDGNAAVDSVKNGTAAPVMSWADTILSELPPDATAHDKARALTDALKAQVKRKKTEGELDNEWERRAAIINRIKQVSEEMWSEVIDAFETRRNAILEKLRADAGVTDPV